MSNVKVIRGQIRQIVQQILPEIMTSELYEKLEAKLKAEMTRRLDIIDNRQKDIQNFMVRQPTTPIVAPSIPPNTTAA